MKGMKGKLLKKLKTVKAIGYLTPDRILQVKALEGYLYTSPPKPAAISRPPLAAIKEEPKQQPHPNQVNSPPQEPEIIDATELMKDLEDEETEFDYKENFRPRMEESKVKDEISEERGFGFGSEIDATYFRKPDLTEFDCKENFRPSMEESKVKGEISEEREFGVRSEINTTSFRKPELNSKTLFDPNLLAAFEQAVMEVKAREADRRSRIKEPYFDEEIDEPPLKSRKIDQIADPLTEFEEKCPPGGGDAVVVYTTGLRGIRKTFEACQKIRSLLENLKILFTERDISMHSEFKEELWRILGGKTVPPRLFIKGRYIGGAEEVIGLHEQGKLKPLIAGMPMNRKEGNCEGCVGFRFMICFNCDGSRKIVVEGDGQNLVCSECNENGLIVCPFCC